MGERHLLTGGAGNSFVSVVYRGTLDGLRLLSPPPPILSSDALLTDMATHPSRNLLAVGDINGRITLNTHTAGEECVVQRSFNHHRKYACRGIQFSKHGDRLYSGSTKEDSLYVTDVETGTLLRCCKKSHSGPVYTMHTVSEATLATGDDTGEIKLWDTRSWRPVMKLRENEEFISDMDTDEGLRTLLATCADGSLTAVDLRQRKLEQKSDPSESELLSLAIIKGGKRVVCGDSEGVLMIFHWGLWGDITDQYPVHTQSIDSLVAISNSIVCTGCMDGAVRSVQILPNKVMGTVGHHTDGFFIKNMCLTCDNNFLVTGSQDSCKFWSVEDILSADGTGQGEGRGEVGEEDKGRRKRRKRKGRSRKKVKDESDSDEDESSGSKASKTAKEDFFADL